MEIEELALGTDLNLADTDADGVFDDVEVEIGTDPTNSNDFANMDSDGDGLSDLFELNFGTDPNDPDTNDNGMNDGEELDNRGDPINPGPAPYPRPRPQPPPRGRFPQPPRLHRRRDGSLSRQSPQCHCGWPGGGACSLNAEG